MKFVVPLTIPWIRSIGVADSDSSRTRTTGTTPATAASKRRRTPCSRAVSNSSSPCWESSCLLALTTSIPARIAVNRYSRAGSIPPISSTSRSAPAMISSKLPRERVRMPLITGRWPLKRAISSARSSSSTANAAPTVPWPSRPTRNSGASPAPSEACSLADIACGQILVALAPDDDTRVAVLAEDHRRTRDAVVVVGHRVAVRTRGRGHDHVARPRIVKHRVAHDHVARLAVLAREHALHGAAEAVRDVRFVGRAVEHRAHVVGHAAIDGDPPRDVLLDALHRVQRHSRVCAQRPARLEQQARLSADPMLVGSLDDRRHVVLDRRRSLLLLGVLHAQPTAQVPDREPTHRLAKAGELADLAPDRLEAEQLRTDVRVQALQRHTLERAQLRDRLARVSHVEAELRVGLAG